MNEAPRNHRKLRHPLTHKVTSRVVIQTLLEGIVDPNGIDASSSRLHLNLGIVYPRFVIEELLRKKVCEEPPIKKEVVRCKADKHRPHSKV
jgi:hypothetical protein